MSVPESLRYTSSHEWLRFENGDTEVVIGITHHAQEQLGEVIYLGDFPGVGDTIASGDVIAVVESVKAASDVYSPVAGTIVAVNEAGEESPEQVNSAPYEGGWMVRIRVAPPLPDLLDAAAYSALLGG